MRIQCDRCGYVTSFIEDGQTHRRDFKVHGNNAIGLTCFNCNTPLKIAVKEPEPKVEPKAAPVETVNYNVEKTKKRSNK